MLTIKKYFTPQFVREHQALSAIGLLVSLGVLTLCVGLVVNPAKLKDKFAWYAFQTKTIFSTAYYQSFGEQPMEISIVTSKKNWDKITTKRSEALAKQLLVTSDDDLVNADLIVNDQTYPAKIRLKGDWTDHLEGDKWSFRVHLKDGATIMGMNKFSLQDPKTRRYTGEWLAHELLRQEGLIGYRYEFVALKVNGQNRGIFAIEEHPTKLLIENNNRREAPLIKFDESKLWQHIDLYGISDDFNVDNYFQATVEPFGAKATEENPLFRSQFKAAEELLLAYRAGNKQPTEVFDLDQWAKFIALSDVLGIRHGLHWHNLRFYYNPITGLIEPVGYDMLPLNPLQGPLALNYNSYILTSDILRRDIEFQKRYTQYLDTFSQPEYITESLERLQPEIKPMLEILNQELIQGIPKVGIELNIQKINEAIHTPPQLIISQTSDTTFELTSESDFPFEVLEIRDSSDTVIAKEQTLVRKYPEDLLIQPISTASATIAFNEVVTEQHFPLTVTTRFLGLESTQVQPVDSRE